MKILLVQLPTSHFGAQEKVYPLGLSRLASTIPAGMEKRSLDMNVSADPWLEFGDLLQNYAPEIVAFSFRNIDPLAGQQSSYVSSLTSGAALARRLLPESRLLAGGPAFSLFARQLMERCPELDIGMIGEGETAFAMLLAPEPLLAEIPGIIYRDGGCLQTNAGTVKTDMNNLPPIDVSSFPPVRYTGGNKYVAPVGIEGKRGCDLACGYCLYPKLGGRQVRLRDPKRIVDEIEFFVKEHGIGLFHFTDPVVNRPLDHFTALCLEFNRRRFDCRWTGFFREDLVSVENLSQAMEAGLCCVYFSGDALTRRGLKLLGKQLRREDILHASRVTAELRLLTVCHFMVNLPGDTTEDITEAGALLDELLAIHHPAGNLGAVIFNHIRLYPDAPLTRRLQAAGLLDATQDLLFPVYYNQPEFSHVLHEFETKCHRAGVFSRLEIAP